MIFAVIKAAPPPLGRGKRIWCINLFFGQGTAPTGVLLDSLARALARDVWSVEIITGRIGHNAVPIAKREPFPGRVHRLFSGPRRARGAVGRFLSWFAFTCAVVAHASTHRLPDEVIVLTTPPLLHAVFVLRTLLGHRPFRLTLWCQDTYPDILAAVGLVRPRSLIYRVLERMQHWATRRVDRVVVLDGAMRARLLAHGAKHVAVIPNWTAPAEAVTAGASREWADWLRRIRASHRYLIVYTGNYGWGHDLSAIFACLRERPGQRDFFFSFVGGGEKWAQLTALCQQLPRCTAIGPYVNESDLAAIVQAAHFGLVALEPACAGLMAPSKMHGYLARGKPVLYLGPAGSNVAEAIETFSCGLRFDPDDCRDVARGLDALLTPGFNYASLANNAETAYRRRYCEAAAHADFRALFDGQPANSR